MVINRSFERPTSYNSAQFNTQSTDQSVRDRIICRRRFFGRYFITLTRRVSAFTYAYSIVIHYIKSGCTARTGQLFATGYGRTMRVLCETCGVLLASLTINNRMLVVAVTDAYLNSQGLLRQLRLRLD